MPPEQHENHIGSPGLFASVIGRRRPDFVKALPLVYLQFLTNIDFALATATYPFTQRDLRQTLVVRVESRRMVVTTFVHIADERDAASIRRSGLTLPKSRFCAFEDVSFYKWGVFALPVTDDYFVTHQWVRELKRRGHRQPAGVYFRVPDNEPVWNGRYGREKEKSTAAQAAMRLHNEGMLGFEVIIPRSIAASEILSIRPLPSVGWRFSPEAKGRTPCVCRFCTKGEINNRRMRKRLDPEGRNY